MNKKCGYISIIGVANSGKSTLLNSILKSKISITSHKVQTTRKRILGIYTKASNKNFDIDNNVKNGINDNDKYSINSNTQYIFIDTPGFFSRSKISDLEKSMLKEAKQSLTEADLIMVLIDSMYPIEKQFDSFKKFINTDIPVVFALNKIDMLKDKTYLLKNAEFIAEKFPNYKEVFMISAKKNYGVDEMLQVIEKYLPNRDWLFPEDQMTNITEKFWVAELTREQVYLQLHEELPYSIDVETDSFKEIDQNASIDTENNINEEKNNKINKSIIEIYQSLIVFNKSHKPIILGKGGSKIKEISTRARKEISRQLGCGIRLYLNVKVREKRYVS